jgi:hypothetical protein
MFFIGTFTGAMVLYLLRKVFLANVEKLLAKKSNELQEMVTQNIKKFYTECQDFHEIMQREADLTLSLQQEARKEINSLILQLNHLRNEVESAHNLRTALENEITKLKNIIKRQNKQKEQ